MEESVGLSVFLRGFVLFSLLMSTLAPKANAWNDREERRLISQQVSGPAPYHPSYGSIKQTYITIQDFDLKLEDGGVIHIDTAPMKINLQDLIGVKNGVSKGIPLDLRNVAFPRGATTIAVAEIETKILSGKGNCAKAVQESGSSCCLTTPKRLNLYTLQEPKILFKDVFNIKLFFDPLAAIQIDKVRKTYQRYEGGSWFEGDSSDHWKKKGRSKYYDCYYCSLVNQRHPITDIIRPIDEA